MRNESKFYQDKENKEISKFHELCKKLPIYARRYLQNREMAVKYSTLVAYTYDLQTFFEFLKENNPELESMETREIPACRNVYFLSASAPDHQQRQDQSKGCP